MKQTSAAMSEIIRVAWWSLRALGCPAGAVERMAKVLAFSEVLEGECVSALRRDEASLIATFKAPAPRFIPAKPDGGIIEASGRSLLDVGTRAIDLLTGQVKHGNRPVQIRINDASDRLGLSGACTLAARRGVGVLAIMPGESGHRAWHYYASTESGVESVSGLAHGGGNAWFDLFGQLAGTDIEPLRSSAALDSNGASIDLLGVVHRAGNELRAYASQHAGIVWTDVENALQAAYSNGVTVMTEDLKFLYELETRTWAPSSERSRMQAGFGAPSPAA